MFAAILLTLLTFVGIYVLILGSWGLAALVGMAIQRWWGALVGLIIVIAGFSAWAWLASFAVAAWIAVFK